MDRINIGPDELETSIAVSTLGSFRRAAEKLGVSQPSVTSRVQRLETILGVKLLNRTTRRVTTTEAGERLRLRAELLAARRGQCVDEGLRLGFGQPGIAGLRQHGFGVQDRAAKVSKYEQERGRAHQGQQAGSVHGQGSGEG